MPRRRAADPTIAISITVPRTLLDRIDDQLTRKQSRSAWLAAAANEKLGMPNDGSELTVHRLLWELRRRGVIDKILYETLMTSA